MMCNDNSNDRLWMFMIYVKREGGRERERVTAVESILHWSTGGLRNRKTKL